MSARPQRRVVVTGVGVVAPGGVGREPFWTQLQEGRTATRRLSNCPPEGFRSQVAAEVDLPADVVATRPDGTVLDRATVFAMVAAREAWADAAPASHYAAERLGVCLGSAVGATTSLERVYRDMSHEGELWNVVADAPSELYDYFVPSSIAAEVAELVGADGPVRVISTGCTSGIDAVGQAADLIRSGVLDAVVSGATEAPISEITVACFDSIRATSTDNETPERASRPFDATRGGFVLGEGAAVFVLEELTHALDRGATIYAEVVGYGSRCNAHHMTGLRADGVELAEAVTAALEQAQVSAPEIDYVNAHGSGTKQNDLHETAALLRSLGERAREVPISSIKSMVGHSLGAIGSIEIAACLLVLRDGVVPPTANLTTPDPDLPLDYVPNTSRAVAARTVLTTGSGFGGFQSAMVLRTLEVAR
ncbi:MAG: beta-ketoacyl-[acyl-carrier-protein] synthase family protein [Aeromicrobium erythreum]